MRHIVALVSGTAGSLEALAERGHVGKMQALEVPPGPAPPITGENSARTQVGLPWLVRLRWGTLGGFLIAVLATSSLMEVRLPILSIAGAFAITVATNLGAAREVARRGTISPGWGAFLLSCDVVLLTVLLHFTGGPTNPFSILYLVYITLAAVVLGATWTWSLAAVAITSYGVLFLTSDGFSGAGSHHSESADFSRHLVEMWAAFAAAAGLIALLVVRLAAAIERRDTEIIAIREQVSRAQRLAALTTLAAGAAHELGTPLATIAVAAKELERAIAALPQSAARPLYDDTRLIRAELDRCRRILDRMAVHSGEMIGEAPAHVAVRDLPGDVLAELNGRDAARVSVSVASDCESVNVPRGALVQSILSLIRNALEATPPGRMVRLCFETSAQRIRVSVRDEGPGMAPEVLARAGEPFFTTKPAGHGMGLGLFLARTVTEQMGGRFELESQLGRGVKATIDLPSVQGGPPHA